MKKTILLVDDAAFIRMKLKSILEQADYEVVGEAENGQVAIQKYVDLKPDLVIMDITMAEMDGIEALKGIKAKDPDAKVVMCSAMGQQGKVVNAIEAGAADFIVKPFQDDRVIAAVKRTLGD